MLGLLEALVDEVVPELLGEELLLVLGVVLNLEEAEQGLGVLGGQFLEGLEGGLLRCRRCPRHDHVLIHRELALVLQGLPLGRHRLSAGLG